MYIPPNPATCTTPYCTVPYSTYFRKTTLFENVSQRLGGWWAIVNRWRSGRWDEMGGCAEGGRRGENRRIGEERREKGEALGAWWEIARVDEMNLDIILPHLNNFLFGFRYDNRQLPPTYHLPHLSFFLSSSYPTPQSQNTHPPPRQKPIIDHYHTLQTPHPHPHPHSLTPSTRPVPQPASRQARAPTKPAPRPTAPRHTPTPARSRAQTPPPPPRSPVRNCCSRP